MTRHFLAITDLSPDEIHDLLQLAIRLKQEGKNGLREPLLKDRALAMVFQKPSLRTRVSFERAMQQLGGYAIYISPAEIGLGQRESVADVSRVLSGYVDAIMARVFDHKHILDLAKFASVPVINGLSDYNHPCQALADALTMLEEFKDLKGRRLAFIGDGNNVAVSLLHLCAKLGMHFCIASPAGYELPEAVVTLGKSIAAQSGSQITLVRNPKDAAHQADVLYTDTWTSMGQEAETQKRRDSFSGYQINSALLSLAKPEAIVMHCLPAHRGDEITDEVADGFHSRLFQESENRMHAQKAILAHLLT